MSIPNRPQNRSRQSRLKRRRSNKGEPLGSPRFTIFVTNRLTLFRITSRPMLSRRVGSLKCICPKNLHFPPSICLRTDNRNPPNSIARRSERRTRTHTRLGAPKVQNLAPPRGRSYLQLSIFRVLQAV